MSGRGLIFAALIFFAFVADAQPSMAQAERPLLAISTDAAGNFVFQSAASFIVTPAADVRVLAATISDVDGNEVKRLEWVPLGGGRYSLNVTDLPVGYYSLSVSARAGKGNPQTMVKSFAIVGAPISKAESRFGIDAALSWYGGSEQEISRAIYAMNMAGIGSVRDRLSWSKVEPSRGTFNWGRFAQVAKQVNGAGIDQVTVFHDSPPWTRPSDAPSLSGDRKPSLDNDAVREFGQAFARDMGRYVNSVEYWNEQNGDFFAGTPMQYANGLRAFAAGLWSVNPNLPLLIGAASNAPGKFSEEVYRNDVGAWFNVRNQHYYGDPDQFLSFYFREVGPIDKAAGVETKRAWLTEAGYGLRLDGNGSRSAAEREQAIHLVKTYATAFAAGYERVFYFFLRELLEEGRNNWGILNSDFTPRPAYVALANLTRRLNGKPLAGYMKADSSFAAYFGSANDGYVAIAWGMPLGELGGAPGSASDIFGRKIVDGAPGAKPLMVGGIKKIPASLTLPMATSSGKNTVPPILIESQVPGSKGTGAHVTEVPIPASGDVALRLRLVRLEASKSNAARVECEGGSGLSVSTPVLDVRFSRSGDSTVIECQFNAALRAGARSAISATVSADGWSGKTYASVVAIPTAMARRAPTSTLRSVDPSICVKWRSRSSPVVQSKVDTEQVEPGRNCGNILVTSKVVSPGDGWVFPIADMPAGTTNLVGLEFESYPVQGQSYPPKPLMMQVVDSKGGIWVLPLYTVRRQDGSFSHEATFARAILAAWSKVKSNEPLDVSAIKQISIGYAGGGTKPGDVVGFKVSGLRGVEGR